MQEVFELYRKQRFIIKHIDTNIEFEYAEKN